MKSTSFRFNEHDTAKILELKAITKLESDLDVIRFALTSCIAFGITGEKGTPLTNAIVVDKAVEKVHEIKEPIKKRKYSDLDIMHYRDLMGYPKDSCPQHPALLLYQCSCWYNRDELAKWMREQYE
jgi:hypothetical protein